MVLKAILRQKGLVDEKEIKQKSLCQISGIIHPVTLNKIREQILEGAFGLQTGPTLFLEQFVGYSYNVFKDEIKDKCIYANYEEKPVMTEFGFSIPAHIFTLCQTCCLFV